MKTFHYISLAVFCAWHNFFCVCMGKGINAKTRKWRKLGNNGKRFVYGSNLEHPTSDIGKSRFLTSFEMTGKGARRPLRKGRNAKGRKERKPEKAYSWGCLESGLERQPPEIGKKQISRFARNDGGCDARNDPDWLL